NLVNLDPQDRFPLIGKAWIKSTRWRYIFLGCVCFAYERLLYLLTPQQNLIPEGFEVKLPSLGIASYQQNPVR
ncbi:MAG: hypothetical protein MUP44_00840, partial [Anaerolineales bacterium]|nr:hypothetical protein [Anaerolineales bacterium]